MTTPLLVKPELIESQLIAIWEKLAKENKMRACLFNLIVFNRYSHRTDYIRSIVEKVIEKFPCRIIFISEEPDARHSYLKAAVSVMMPQGPTSTIACDHIDIGVAGDEVSKIPYLILPHILPDLPVTLLWAEDPCFEHPLLDSLAKLSHRIIFDSESADCLLKFSKTVLSIKNKYKVDIADLNWARTEGWRDLIASLFNSEERIKKLRNVTTVQIEYNSRSTEFFCHLKVQSMYLLSWLSSRLDWNCKQATQDLHFEFNHTQAAITATEWDKLGSGTITAVNLTTADKEYFDCKRVKDNYHYVSIEISSEEKCDIPYLFLLGQTATGQSLVKEICIKGTSLHYLNMLKHLEVLDKDQLC